MTAEEVLAALVALAGEAGIRVREARAAEAGGPLASALCRVRGEVVVVLVAGDPAEERIALLARALRENAPALVEARWFPPAVRARLDAAG